MYDKAIKYFSKHIFYNSTIHFIGGVGFGILIARPFVANPVRWGVILLAAAVAGHFLPFVTKKIK